jgi:hypothetical protein
MIALLSFICKCNIDSFSDFVEVLFLKSGSAGGLFSNSLKEEYLNDKRIFLLIRLEYFQLEWPITSLVVRKIKDMTIQSALEKNCYLSIILFVRNNSLFLLYPSRRENKSSYLQRNSYSHNMQQNINKYYLHKRPRVLSLSEKIYGRHTQIYLF